MKKTPDRISKSKTKRTEFKLHAPEAQRVAVTGDFNGWDVNALPMNKDRDGTWGASVALSPGRYEYRFWVDGVWQDDPTAHERVENPFGSQNCVRMMR